MPVEMRPVAWSSDAEGLDDSRWKDTQAVRLVDVLTGAPPRWSTEVRIVRTPGELVIRFACTAGTIMATMTRYKDKVWQEDAVEVYLCPAESEMLYELQLSPIGTFRDLQVWRFDLPERCFDDSWSCAGARTDARIMRSTDHAVTGWQALFGLPWKSLGNPSSLRGWRIGLFRIERDPLEYSALASCATDEVDLHDPRLLVPLS